MKKFSLHRASSDTIDATKVVDLLVHGPNLLWNGLILREGAQV